MTSKHHNRNEDDMRMSHDVARSPHPKELTVKETPVDTRGLRERGWWWWSFGSLAPSWGSNPPSNNGPGSCDGQEPKGGPPSANGRPGRTSKYSIDNFFWDF